MNNACIIGFGTVGRATAEAFGIKDYYSRSGGNITLKQAGDYKYIFICLPTPNQLGIQDSNPIVDIIDKIKSESPSGDNVFIIRSTVLPGFNKELQRIFGGQNFVSNPEFLSEDTAIEDAKNPDLIVLGSDDPQYTSRVEALYRGRFKTQEILKTDSVTAELIKYSLNTFFTTKVIFANEIYDYAQEVKANYETVKHVLETHRWGSKNHFTVQYKGKRGVHGKCLPKDTEALATDTNSPFFRMLLERNERIKKNG